MAKRGSSERLNTRERALSNLDLCLVHHSFRVLLCMTYIDSFDVYNRSVRQFEGSHSYFKILSMGHNKIQDPFKMTSEAHTGALGVREPPRCMPRPRGAP